MSNAFSPAERIGAHPVHPVTYGANTHKLTVVVPCYNEAQRLQSKHFLTFIDTSVSTRLLLVNDGSTDGSLAKLTALAEARPGRIEVLDLARNGGKAEAVRAGLGRALEDGADLVAYWDADLATPLYLVEDFMRIALHQPDVEVIFGSRRKMLGHRVERTIPRRIVSRICAGLARLAIGLPIADTQCGAKMFRATPALTQAISTPFTAGWLFDVELFARIASCEKAKKANLRFYEQPLAEWSEVPGSKVSASAIFSSGIRMLRLIAELRLDARAHLDAQGAQGAIRKAI